MWDAQRRRLQQVACLRAWAAACAATATGRGRMHDAAGHHARQLAMRALAGWRGAAADAAQDRLAASAAALAAWARARYAVTFLAWLRCILRSAAAMAALLVAGSLPMNAGLSRISIFHMAVGGLSCASPSMSGGRLACKYQN